MTLVATRVQGVRTAYAGVHDKNENRPSNVGVLDAFKIDSNSIDSILPPDVKTKVQSSFNNTFKIPVQNKFTTSVLTSRPVTIATTTGTSALVTVSFATKGFDITINPAYFQNNDISMQQEFNRQYKTGMETLAKEYENYMISALDTAKNQQYAGTLAASKYTVSSNIIQVPKADKYLFIEDMATILEENDFDSNELICLSKTGYRSDVTFAGAQGGGNYYNYTYQFNGKNFFFSNRIDAGAGLAEGYFLPAGTLGFITRNDFDSQMGNKSIDGHEWGLELDPITGLIFDTYYYETAEDVHAIDASATGNTASLVQKFRFTIDLAVILPYNSNQGTSITDESVTLTALGTAYDLAQNPVELNSVVVTTSPAGTTYTETTDYTIDYVTGTITGVSTGAISAGDAVLVDYTYGNASAVHKFLIKTT